MSCPQVVPLQTDRRGGGAAPTALEACLIHAAALVGRPVMLVDVQAAQAGTDAALSVRAALEAAERAGLLASFGRLKLSDLDGALFPVILILSRDRAVVAEGRAGDRLVIHDPALGDASGEVTLDTLEDAYSGFALLLRPRHRLAAGQAPQGHWFWSALAESRWMYAQVILAAVVANFLGLATSIFTMVVYDRVLPNEAVESLMALTLGVGIALVFDFLIKGLRAGFIDRAGQRADKAVGRRIFDQVLDVQMQARRGSTGATANTLREFETLREFFTSATLVAVVDLPFVTLFVFVIWLIGGPLALIPALAVPLVLLIGLAVQPVLARLAESATAEAQTKQSVLVETLSGLETIKAVGIARQMRDRWEAAIERQADHGLRARGVTQFAMNATAFTQQAAQVLLIFYGVFLIMAGQVSMGALIASVILTGRTLAPLAQLAQTLTRINQARTSYRALDTLMRADRDRPQGGSWLSRPVLEGAITFDDVRLSYPDAATETLRGISFSIAPGEKVAILGRIGCGKSTIARMILGLYRPTSGTVLIDGTDLRQIDPADLRRNIGAVLQDSWLFSGTLRDNIAVGAVRPSDAAVLAAARVSGVDDFVSRHPQGYDMPLAERGEGLSGGQRQAICVARALIGAPPILVLDEPTASMDSQTEADLIRRLRPEAADRTLVVITHRPSLLELVDRVIVIDQGRVVADGPKSILARAAAGKG
jgi:ATP-binding cassette subfamily C protein LapB